MGRQVWRVALPCARLRWLRTGWCQRKCWTGLFSSLRWTGLDSSRAVSTSLSRVMWDGKWASDRAVLEPARRDEVATLDG